MGELQTRRGVGSESFSFGVSPANIRLFNASYFYRAAVPHAEEADMISGTRTTQQIEGREFYCRHCPPTQKATCPHYLALHREVATSA